MQYKTPVLYTPSYLDARHAPAAMDGTPPVPFLPDARYAPAQLGDAQDDLNAAQQPIYAAPAPLGDVSDTLGQWWGNIQGFFGVGPVATGLDPSKIAPVIDLSAHIVAPPMPSVGPIAAAAPGSQLSDWKTVAAVAAIGAGLLLYFKGK